MNGSERTGSGSRRSARSVKGTASGPFVDRVAMLLDPSLMEQARREAGKFQNELNAAADRVLQKVFSRHAQTERPVADVDPELRAALPARY